MLSSLARVGFAVAFLILAVHLSIGEVARAEKDPARYPNLKINPQSVEKTAKDLRNHFGNRFDNFKFTVAFADRKMLYSRPNELKLSYATTNGIETVTNVEVRKLAGPVSGNGFVSHWDIAKDGPTTFSALDSAKSSIVSFPTGGTLAFITATDPSELGVSFPIRAEVSNAMSLTRQVRTATIASVPCFHDIRTLSIPLANGGTAQIEDTFVFCATNLLDFDGPRQFHQMQRAVILNGERHTIFDILTR